jgi:hypothetical protein
MSAVWDGIKVSVGPRRRPYRCSACATTFASLDALWAHEWMAATKRQRRLHAEYIHRNGLVNL